MFQVIAYRDLRPFDWVSGKRMPLEPGAGHICDRCGAEHAIVFTVLDTDSNKTYEVGSGCAKQQFGFEPDKDAQSRLLVRTARRQTADAIDAERQLRALELAERIYSDVFTLPVPTAVRGTSIAGCKTWIVGDSAAWQHDWDTRSDAAIIAVAIRGWYDRRIYERIPGDIKNVTLRQTPGGSPAHTEAMSARILHAVMTKIRKTIVAPENAPVPRTTQ